MHCVNVWWERVRPILPSLKESQWVPKPSDWAQFSTGRRWESFAATLCLWLTWFYILNYCVQQTFVFCGTYLEQYAWLACQVHWKCSCFALYLHKRELNCRISAVISKKSHKRNLNYRNKYRFKLKVRFCIIFQLLLFCQLHLTISSLIVKRSHILAVSKWMTLTRVGDDKHSLRKRSLWSALAHTVNHLHLFSYFFLQRLYLILNSKLTFLLLR